MNVGQQLCTDTTLYKCQSLEEKDVEHHSRLQSQNSPGHLCLLFSEGGSQRSGLVERYGRIENSSAKSTVGISIPQKKGTVKTGIYTCCSIPRLDSEGGKVSCP